MPFLSKLKSVFCCNTNKYILDDDDDDVASIIERCTMSQQEEEEVSEKPLLNDFENKFDSPTTRPFYQTNQVIVKSVLRKKRNASVSSTKSHSPRRRYNILLFGDNLTAGKIFN